MSTYAIGDVQGCFATLQRLLASLGFDRHHDHLWFCGDLVNRGPQSLDTLRFVRELGDRATVILGNHDLHLLAVANGRKPGRRDTLGDILAAPDRAELLDWLRHQPLIHHDPRLGFTMLHAGLPPEWTLLEALRQASAVEQVLRDKGYAAFLTNMYGDQPGRWEAARSELDRLRFTVNCLTRLRYCHPDGRLALEAKGAPGDTPGLQPWFQLPTRRSSATTIVFGHWSTLGRVEWPDEQVFGLDTGAVWGQRLTALRLEDRQLFSVPSPAYSPID